MKNMFINNAIEINAKKERVWEVLVNPEETKKYMFGCVADSDWKEGSDLLWKGSFEGKEMVFVKGKILEIYPNKILRYSVIDPNNSEIPDIQENYLEVTYLLEEKGNHILLKVSQGDYSKVAMGEARYKESYNSGKGWSPILEQIKGLAEM